MSRTNKTKLLSLCLTLVFSIGLLVISNRAYADGLGLSRVFGTGGLFTGASGEFDARSAVITGFQLLLGGVIAYCLFYAVMAGARFAKAKDSADDRKKQLQALLSALGGVLIATLGVPFAQTLRARVGPTGQNEAIGTPCSGVTTVNGRNIIKIGVINEQGECVDDNNVILNPIPTPTP